MACVVLVACGSGDHAPRDSDATHSDSSNELRDAESTVPDEDTPGTVDEATGPLDDAGDEVTADVEDSLDLLHDDVEIAVEVDDVVHDVDETETEDSSATEDLAVAEETSSEDADTVAEADAEPSDAAACPSTLLTHTSEGQAHVASCSVVTYSANPPTSGDHYGVWPQWKVYKMPVPRGFYVHALEHGGIVFAYNCPDGCSEEIGALTAMLASRPPDPQCPLGVTNRFIVTPDPLLDTRFAAAAWEQSLESECMDLVAMSSFIDAYYGRGPERDCIQGADVSNSSIPGTYCPPACSWCNPPIP